MLYNLCVMVYRVNFTLEKFAFACFLRHWKVSSVYSNSIRGDQWCHCSLKDSYSWQVVNMIPIEERFILMTVTKNMKIFICCFIWTWNVRIDLQYDYSGLASPFYNVWKSYMFDRIYSFTSEWRLSDRYSISLFSFDFEMDWLSIREHVRLHFCLNCWQGIFFIFSCPRFGFRNKVITWWSNKNILNGQKCIFE